MTLERKQRLKELKRYYLWKYTIMPALITTAHTTPFDTDTLAKAAIELGRFDLIKAVKED